MSKTELCKPHNPFSTIASAMRRNGVKNEKDVYVPAQINNVTWRARRDETPERLTVEQIRAIDEVLGFTDSELIELIRGRR